jgi:hypothetical protein
VGYDLLVTSQNRRENEDDTEHASRYSSLLRLKTSRARVFQFYRSCGSEAKDDRFDGVGCGAVKVRRKYPSLVIISFSACRAILVFWLNL